METEDPEAISTQNTFKCMRYQDPKDMYQIHHVARIMATARRSASISLLGPGCTIAAVSADRHIYRNILFYLLEIVIAKQASWRHYPVVLFAFNFAHLDAPPAAV